MPLLKQNHVITALYLVDADGSNTLKTKKLTHARITGRKETKNDTASII